MNKEHFIIWLAGLFEGEGTFVFLNGKTKGMSITSTDLDVLQRVKENIGGYIYTTHTRKSHWKQAYIWRISGFLAKEIILKIKPYLLSRRQLRAEEWLTQYESNFTFQNAKKEFTKSKYEKVIELSKTGLLHKDIASQLGYRRSSVTKILNNNNIFAKERTI